MLYERVHDEEGPDALQRREVHVDVTDATAGQAIVFTPGGRWEPRTLTGDGSTPDYSGDLAELFARVAALEAGQLQVYVGTPDGEYMTVRELWIDPDTGDVSAVTEGS